MHSFECRVTDSRYEQCEITWLLVEDAGRACELVRRHLRADTHRLAGELWEDGRLFFTVYRADLPQLVDVPAAPGWSRWLHEMSLRCLGRAEPRKERQRAWPGTRKPCS
jgi:hypothetical protein